MLKLFADLFGFGRGDSATLPASLLDQLVERAVDGTDPRMRIISRYGKILRDPVAHAATYIIDMIARLPPPLLLAPGSLRESPLLNAFLYSEAEAERFLARDAALLEYRASRPTVTGAITALLVVQQSEKHGFGYAQVGEQAIADVPKTTLSFSHHRLLELAETEGDTRRGIKRRAFDQLLAVALALIARRSDTRAELATQRALLRSKLDIIRRSGSFDSHAAATEQASLQVRVKEIEDKLAILESSADTLQDNLDAVVDVLAHAERHLWLQENILHLDRFYVVHDKPVSGVPDVVCWNLHNSEGRQVTLQMVRLPAACVWPV